MLTQLKMHVDLYWCVSVYITYLMTFGCKYWWYILKYFFNYFFLSARPHPLKKHKIILLFWHHQSIIIKLESCIQKTVVCLFCSTDNLFTIAQHFSYNGLSFLGLLRHFWYSKCSLYWPVLELAVYE